MKQQCILMESSIIFTLQAGEHLGQIRCYILCKQMYDRILNGSFSLQFHTRI